MKIRKLLCLLLCALVLTVVFSFIFAYKATRVQIVDYLKAE